MINKNNKSSIKKNQVFKISAVYRYHYTTSNMIYNYFLLEEGSNWLYMKLERKS